MDWTGARYADKPTVEVGDYIDAPPAEVWRLVADLRLMPSMSDELQSIELLDGATESALGVRFVGRSSHPDLGEWATTSTIVEFEPERVFAWAVVDPDDPTAIWRFSLTPEGQGTRLSHWMQMGPARSGLNFAIDRMPEKEEKIVFVRMREFERNMARTVSDIKNRVESQHAAAAGNA